jgi:hypothetical protein
VIDSIKNNKPVKWNEVLIMLLIEDNLSMVD